MYLHSFINQDYFTAISYISEQYKLYKSHTELFVRKEFCQLISNFLYFCSLTKNEELFSTIMYEFSNIKNQSKEETDFIQKIKYFRTLALYHQIKQYDKAELLAFEAEKYIEEKNHSITNVENKIIVFLISLEHLLIQIIIKKLMNFIISIIKQLDTNSTVLCSNSLSLLLIINYRTTITYYILLIPGQKPFVQKENNFL
jgi:hypothetical protein